MQRRSQAFLLEPQVSSSTFISFPSTAPYFPVISSNILPSLAPYPAEVQFSRQVSISKPSLITEHVQDMCDKRMIHFAGCGHTWSAETLKCAAARARPRPGQTPCVPLSGHQRDLDQVLDIQDRNTAGKCPACGGTTPPSSQGSQG